MRAFREIPRTPLDQKLHEIGKRLGTEDGIGIADIIEFLHVNYMFSYNVKERIGRLYEMRPKSHLVYVLEDNEVCKEIIDYLREVTRNHALDAFLPAKREEIGPMKWEYHFATPSVSTPGSVRTDYQIGTITSTSIGTGLNGPTLTLSGNL